MRGRPLKSCHVRMRLKNTGRSGIIRNLSCDDLPREVTMCEGLILRGRDVPGGPVSMDSRKGRPVIHREVLRGSSQGKFSGEVLRGSSHKTIERLCRGEKQ